MRLLLLELRIHKGKVIEVQEFADEELDLGPIRVTRSAYTSQQQERWSDIDV